ncbi:uncharacterized protein LOC121375817 [Gigantopelta aegis]|uniref:uncharacterized protein LOC121375817 n=1 Tax=Gigantopelta aegis TaxID=1735272 RepID=UPI001B88A562|nr:uncharacterized protein LOC121375817 [Gigantopelta aegis]
MADGQKAFEEPDCDYDESTKPGYVRIRLHIPGIEPRTAGSLSKILSKDPKAKNAKFIGPVCDIRSYDLKIVGEADLKDQNYMFTIKRLPFDIIPYKCTFEVQKNWVYVFLKKKEKDQSWEQHLRAGSLETSD